MTPVRVLCLAAWLAVLVGSQLTAARDPYGDTALAWDKLIKWANETTRAVVDRFEADRANFSRRAAADLLELRDQWDTNRPRFARAVMRKSLTVGFIREYLKLSMTVNLTTSFSPEDLRVAERDLEQWTVILASFDKFVDEWAWIAAATLERGP